MARAWRARCAHSARRAACSTAWQCSNKTRPARGRCSRPARRATAAWGRSADSASCAQRLRRRLLKQQQQHCCCFCPARAGTAGARRNRPARGE
eukprot:8142785-Alexandrium_andersonii.AAC.1